MSNQTKETVRSWLEMHKGDVEGLARWMSRTLRLGGIRSCRALIEEALS